MPLEHERWVGHLSLYLHVKGQPTSDLSLTDALRTLDKILIAGQVHAQETLGDSIIQLAKLEMAPGGKTAHLLFLGIDKKKAEAVYGHTGTLTLRQLAKSPDEGGAVTAHLVISLKPDAAGRHNAVLEEIEGMSRSRVLPYLRRLIQEHVSFKETQASGKKLDVESVLSATVVLDKPLDQQLDSVRLVAVDLKKVASKSSIDQADQYYEKERIIRFRPVTRFKGTTARNIINSILEKISAKDYSEVQIRVEEASGRERSINADRSGGDALTGAFQKRSLIKNLHPPLPDACKDIAPHLVKGMIKVL